MQLSAMTCWSFAPERSRLDGDDELWIDGYLLEEHIGSGGTGSVYRVVDRDGAAYAMKLAAPIAHGDDHRNRDRFEREARALSRVSHPGVVALVDRGVTPDRRSYLVLDYLTGATVAELVSEGAVPIATALAIVRATAAALDSVHASGVIHRDVSASNVVLRQVSGGVSPTLIDFGHAWIAGIDMSDLGDGCADHVFGTPYYMSPEHIRGERVDQRSDIYGLGIMLYELVCGAPPFDGDSPAEILREHLYEEVPQLDSPFGDVPEVVDDIVVRCLDKDPEVRYASAAGLAHALGAALWELASGV